VDEAITTVGELTDGPEYLESPTGKAAWFGMSVTTRHRVDDEWVSDPPVVYRVVVSDKENLLLVPSLERGMRILVSGSLHADGGSLVITAEDIAPGIRTHRRA